MKHKKNFGIFGRSLLFAFFIAATVASCSKDKNSEEQDGISRTDFSGAYFDVNGGEFYGRPLPASNTSSIAIEGISGNGTVLAGGTNTIKVVAGEGATEVIVGVKGEKGFFTVPTVSRGNNRGPAAMTEASIQMMISQQLSNDFVLAVGVGDGQGNYGSFEFMDVSLLLAGTGKLQVNVTWDRENDVDLHLTEPNGSHIYYGQRKSSNGGTLDIDSNAACSLDYVNNENITYAYPQDDPAVVVENGEYHVEVDLWSNCQLAENTSYIVRVIYDGVEITPTSGSNPYFGTFKPEDESRNSNRKSVMKFKIDGAAAKGTPVTDFQQHAPKAVKFSFDKNNKVFENFSDKK